MKPQHFGVLFEQIEAAIETISTEGNPQYVYENLARDMAKAAALVYDSCMEGQAFAEQQ